MVSVGKLGVHDVEDDLLAGSSSLQIADAYAPSSLEDGISR